MRRILALAACLLALPAVAAPRRAFEIADYYRTAFPGSPAVAPDGTRIAVAVTRYDLPGAVDWSEIWTMGGHGTRARQLTFGRHHDTMPVFSPDGERLVFVSDRAGEETQLFVMRVDGGEARQLTSFPLALSDPVFSPDGKWIAVTSRGLPRVRRRCRLQRHAVYRIARQAPSGPRGRRAPLPTLGPTGGTAVSGTSCW